MAAWLQLGWTALQPVPPASPALLCRALCRVLCRAAAGGRRGSGRSPRLAGQEGQGRGCFGCWGRVLGRMWLLLTPRVVAEGAGAA